MGFHMNSLKNLVVANAERSLMASKKRFIEEFQNDDITKEVDAGTSAGNSSLLGGKGTLFGLLGFNAGETPSVPVVNILEETINLGDKNNPDVQINGAKITYSFDVNLPPEDKLIEASGLPWNKNISWLYAITDGVPGFTHFIYWKFHPASRSTLGVQAKHAVRGEEFSPASYYFRQMLDKFKANFA
jgi:hypothetical protein